MTRQPSTVRVPAAILVALLYLAAALAMPFAHRASHGGLQVPTAARLAAYALPDGSIPDLCLGGRQVPGDGRIADGSCAACLLAKSPGVLPAAGSGAIVVRRETPMRQVRAIAELPSRSLRLRPEARGPPALA